MTSTAKVTEQQIWTALESVTDPEIPPVSVIDIGMVEDVSVNNGVVNIKMLPTFVGCPAIDIIKNEVTKELQKVAGVKEVNVKFVHYPSWTSERITDEGRERMRKFGIAPPPRDHKQGEEWQVECPFCGSPYTNMDNIFGPAACRSILYCKSCKNPFEAFKPV